MIALVSYEIAERRKVRFALKKKLFLICDDLNPGGAERQSLLLAKKLTENWEPILVSFSDGPLQSEYYKAGIPVHYIERSARFDFLSPLKKLTYLIKSHKPDLLHSWGCMSTIASSLVARKNKIPHIASTVRMGMVPKNAKLLSKLASRLGTYSVANSYAGLSAWNIPNRKGRVVYNGFDWNRTRSCSSDSMLSDKEYRILMVASMSSLKDWQAFLSTAQYISSKDKSISFHGFGDGLCREPILSSARDLLKSGTIFLPGRTSNPISECQNASVGVLFSTFGEGISNSIMEYMACGLPVICSNSGGNPELVTDGITGFLVDPDNNPEQIANRILWLKDNPEKSRAMGLAGKERIKNRFSIEQMVQGYLDLYNQALEA